jgi:hypothetical protein
MTKIGSQDGIAAGFNRLRDLDPGGTLLKKDPKTGKWPDLSTLTAPLDQWKAWDKWQRTEQIEKNDHDAEEDDYRPPGTDLSTAQCRIFLAQAPLDSLAGPAWMVPVCTADPGYRSWYTPDTIARLRSHFGCVEAWCDCRASGGTPYSAAQQMVTDLKLDGPAWGQCETAAEFDHGYESGARRMIGQLAGLRPDQANRVGTAEVLLAFELYRNVMPWQVPDYGTSGAGVGGNAIACYASSTEGAVYTPVATYRELGYYQPKRDSVYGVGLHAQDWIDLA